MNIKIHPSKVSGEIMAPASKSYTNRALILAALTSQPVTIHNPLYSDDTKAMIECLKTLGIRTDENKDFLVVKGSIQNVKDGAYQLNTRLSGTTIRFLLPLLCLTRGVKVLYGEEGLNKRPIGDLVDALQNLGASIEYISKSGYPPVKVLSSKLIAKNISLSGKISSQFLSALLMISPIIGPLTITIHDQLISKPYIDMTIDIMNVFGVDVKNNDYQSFGIGRQEYNQQEYEVEGDYSSAAYFFAIAALTKSKLIIQNLNPKSKQADKEFLGILKKMGNEITSNDQQISIQGTGVLPLDLNMENCPDQAMTVAVLAAFAPGKTQIKGIGSLKVKETDRIYAVTQELEKMNIKTESGESSITIYGGDPKPAAIDTYGDHRITMSFTVAGTKLDGIIINNAEVVNKTFPDFWKSLNLIGIKTQIV